MHQQKAHGGPTQLADILPKVGKGSTDLPGSARNGLTSLPKHPILITSGTRILYKPTFYSLFFYLSKTNLLRTKKLGNKKMMVLLPEEVFDFLASFRLCSKALNTKIVTLTS